MSVVRNNWSAEYGITPDCAGVRVWTRISRIDHPSECAPRIPSPGLYVGICRRLDPTLSAIDGRVLACGWNHYSPHEWLGRGHDQDESAKAPIDDFVAYWNTTQKRPGIVGSTYNSIPEDVFALWRARVPIRDARHISDCASMAVIMTNGRRHVHWKLVRRAIWRKRAENRACAVAYLHEQYKRQLSSKAWAALGRVSVEMQEAVLAELCRRPPNPISTDGQQRLLHASELPWEAAAAVQKQLLAEPTGRLRATLARGKRQAAMLAQVDDPVRWLCPAYPKVSIPQALRLCKGETPVQLSDGVLTRHEAHLWLTTMPNESPIEYLLQTLPNCPMVRSAIIARWLLAIASRGQWPTLERERTVRGPAGVELRIRLIDRIDEIQDEDLDRGPATGVDRAFERTAKRMGSAWLETARKDHRVLASLPKGWQLYRCMRHLCTPATLVREGEEMGHCVGGYAFAVERGQSVILSIRVGNYHSTVELSPQGRVLQHRGPQDGKPHPLCQKVLDRFLTRNRLSAKRAA